MNFSIIIPNYNGAQFLTDCLNSLLTSISKVKYSKFEIILVDNNSKDNSIKIFESIVPKNFHYKILLNSKNHGFALAVNQGIDAAKYEWVVLLNNDVTMNPNWFLKIKKEIKKNKDPKIVTFFGTVLNKAGDKFESQGLKFFYSSKAENISNNNVFLKSEICHLKSKFVWGASAALVVYHKDTLQKIGSFDNDFFAYEEDVDLALRLHNLGYKTLYVPLAICYHLGGGTSNKMGNFRNRMDAKNWIYIIIKNYSKKEIIQNFFPIIEERLRNLSGLIKNTPPKLIFKSLIITYGEVIKNFPKMLKKRKAIYKL